MPDFGIGKSHIGNVRCLAINDETNTVRLTDDSEIGLCGVRAALGAAGNVKTERIVEKSGAKCCKLLGDRPRRHVPGGASGTAWTRGDAKARIAGVPYEPIARRDTPQLGANRGVGGDGENCAARGKAEFTNPGNLRLAAKTGEPRRLYLAERQPDAKGRTAIGKVEDADRETVAEHVLAMKDDDLGFVGLLRCMPRCRLGGSSGQLGTEDRG